MRENVVGEIHSVFRRNVIHQGRKYKQFMAVGVPLAIGKHNNGFDSILGNTRSPVDFHELFLRSFNPDEALYHSWGSLVSKTPAFIDGLRFSLTPEPIEISQEQFERLNTIFGMMIPLDPTKILDPIDRRAHRRIPFDLRVML